jgi:hypothetical protein
VFTFREVVYVYALASNHLVSDFSPDSGCSHTIKHDDPDP